MRGIPIVPQKSPFQSLWYIIMIAATLCYSLVVSYRVIFLYAEPVDGFYWLLVVLYGLDVIAGFLFAVKIKLSIYDSRGAIARHYLRSWFWVDLIAFCPLDAILASSQNRAESGSPVYWVIFAFQILTLVKLGKIPYMLRKIQEFFTLNPAVMRLLSFGFWFVVATHLIALGWVRIGAADTLSAAGLLRAPPDQYLRALYWTVTTVATIGYGDYYPNHDSDIQIVYTIVVQVFGVGIFSYIIGNVAGLVANLDVAKAQFTKKVDEVRDFMRAKHIPAPLQERVNGYYYYLWETRKSTTPSIEVLQELPPTLAIDILLFINEQILQRVDLFRDVDEIFVRDVVGLLQPLVFLPGDNIVTQNEYGDCMYFLTQGEVEVYVGQDVVARLREGSPFGEAALLSGEKRTASVRASTYCDVFKLTRAHFETMRAKYPEFDRKVRKVIRDRGLSDES